MITKNWRTSSTSIVWYVEHHHPAHYLSSRQVSITATASSSSSASLSMEGLDVVEAGLGKNMAPGQTGCRVLVFGRWIKSDSWTNINSWRWWYQQEVINKSSIFRESKCVQSGYRLVSQLSLVRTWGFYAIYAEYLGRPVFSPIAIYCDSNCHSCNPIIYRGICVASLMSVFCGTFQSHQNPQPPQPTSTSSTKTHRPQGSRTRCHQATRRFSIAVHLAIVATTALAPRSQPLLTNCFMVWIGVFWWHIFVGNRVGCSPPLDQKSWRNFSHGLLTNLKRFFFGPDAQLGIFCGSISDLMRIYAPCTGWRFWKVSNSQATSTWHL